MFIQKRYPPHLAAAKYLMTKSEQLKKSTFYALKLTKIQITMRNVGLSIDTHGMTNKRIAWHCLIQLKKVSHAASSVSATVVPKLKVQ